MKKGNKVKDSPARGLKHVKTVKSFDKNKSKAGASKGSTRKSTEQFGNTRPKLTKQETPAGEKQHASLFNNCPFAIIQLDRKTGTILECNKFAAKLLSITTQTKTKKNLRSYLDKNAIAEFDKWMLDEKRKSALKTDTGLRIGNKIKRVSIEMSSQRKNEPVYAFITQNNEIKEKEKLSELNEERLKFALEGSKEGVWDWDITTDEVYYSPGWKEMIGYKNDEIKNDFNEWKKRVHPDDLPFASKELKKALKIKNYNYAVEQRLKCKNGKYKWIVSKGKVILRKKDGKAVRMVGTHIDIDQVKQKEQALRQNEKLISTILQTLPVAVFAKDIKNDFRFYIWNKRAETIFGLKASEALGKSDYYFFSKKDADFFRGKDIEACKINGVLDIPMEVVQTKGGPVTVHTRKMVVKDDKNEPLYLLGVSEDITDLKKAETYLKESEEKFRSLVENSPIIIITTDINEKITFINFTGIGYSREDIVGKSVYDFILPEHIENVRHYHRNVFTTKSIQTYETESANSKNEKVWYQSHVGPILIDGEVNGLTIFTRDITNRKIAEKKIEQSLKEKEVLLNEVHHRVKNNLQIISSILNLQKTKITDKETLDIINDSQDRIKSMSIIHELLYQTKDFSKINFSAYISKIATNLVNSYSKNNNVELILKADPVYLNLDTSIPCGLIVNELVTNALKYAFNEVKKGKLKINLKQTKNEIRLNISDNGKGIPKSINYKKTQSLGMQLVMALLDQIEGEITLDNTRGASYTILFKPNLTQPNKAI